MGFWVQARACLADSISEFRDFCAGILRRIKGSGFRRVYDSGSTLPISPCISVQAGKHMTPPITSATIEDPLPLPSTTSSPLGGFGPQVVDSASTFVGSLREVASRPNLCWTQWSNIAHLTDKNALIMISRAPRFMVDGFHLFRERVVLALVPALTAAPSTGVMKNMPPLLPGMLSSGDTGFRV
jgi:hypothetical protein